MTTTTMTYAALSSFPSSRPSIPTNSSSYSSHRAGAPSLELDLLASLSTFPAPPSHIPASPNPNARYPPSSFASGSGSGSRRPSDSSILSKDSVAAIGRPPSNGGSGPGLPPSDPLPPLPPGSSDNNVLPSTSLSKSTPARPPSSASIRQSTRHASHSGKPKTKPSPLALSLSQPPSARSSAYSEKSELPYAKTKRTSSHSASPSISSTRSFDAPSVSACGSSSGGSSGPNSRQNSLYRVSSISSSSQHHISSESGVPSNGQLYANPPHSPTFSVRSTMSVAESLRNRLAEFGTINPVAAAGASSNNASSSSTNATGTSNITNLAGIGAFGVRRGSSESAMTFGAAGVANGRSSIGSNTSRRSSNSRNSLASSTSRGSRGSRSSSSFGNPVSTYMREDHFSEESEVDGDYDEFGVEVKGKKAQRGPGEELDAMEGELEREMEALEESLLKAPMLSGLASLSPSPSPSPIPPPPPPLSLRIPKSGASKEKNNSLVRALESGTDEETPTRTPTLTSSTSSGTLNSAIVEGEVRTPVDGAPLGTTPRSERGLRRDARAKLGLGLGLQDAKEKPLPLVPPNLGSDEGHAAVTELELHKPKFEMAVCEPSPVRAEYAAADKAARTPAASSRSTAPKEKPKDEKDESEDGSDDFDFPMPPSSVPAVTPVRPSMMKRPNTTRERSNTTTSSVSARSAASSSSSKLVDERPSRSTRREAKGGASSPELSEMILRTSLSTPRGKSKSKSRSRATSRVRSRRSDVMSEESLLFGSEPLLRENEGSGSGSSRGHGEERWPGEGAEWDSEEEEVDSDIDIHTPLPHILLREGVLSPHSRVLATSTPGLSRPASVLTMASDVSRLSVTTKSGLVLMRDTETRRVRHRDGRTLREGLGLTTGLGWSDSEDDEVDVKTWTSSPGVSRQASMASMSSFKSGRSMQRRPGMGRSTSASSLSAGMASPPMPPLTPHTAPPSSFRPKTPVSTKRPAGRTVSAGQLGRVSSIASSVASSTYSGRERDSLFSSASGSSGESFGSRLTMSTSSVRKGMYASSPGSVLSQSTSATSTSSSTCVRTPLSLPRKQHSVPASTPRPGLSQSQSYGTPPQSQRRTASQPQKPTSVPEAQKTLPRMASSSALNALRSKTKVPSRSVGFGRVAREQAVRGTIGHSGGQAKK